MKKNIGLILLSLSLSSFVWCQTYLVNFGAVWKYLDDGSDQGTSWQDVGFDDTSWLSGQSQLGYGDSYCDSDGDEATVISYGSNADDKFRTYYFRHSFDVNDPSQYGGLILKLLRDDGAVVYLNGLEIERSNLPPGEITYLTFASTTVSGGAEDMFYESYEDLINLVTGTNVLAIEVHKGNSTSSVVSFDLELVDIVTRKAPYLIYTNDISEIQVLWQLATNNTCTIEWGTDTQYTLGNTQTIEYGSDHQHIYSIPNLMPETKYYYRVTVNNEIHTGSFCSAPSTDATNIKFFAYGDTRTYPSVHDQVAAAIVNTYIQDASFQSFILSVGDLVANGNNESDWDNQFFDPSYSNIQQMLATLSYQSTMGNHELEGILFTKYFPYPFEAGRYWSFDYGPAHFLMVDQYTNYSPGSTQLTWIENDLTATTKPWKFIILHEPGWSAGHHENNVDVQNSIQPLCETYGVSIVFAGNNHYYARAEVNSVQHITTGGGGAPLYLPDLEYPNIVAGEMAHHFCKIEIDGDFLTLKVVTPAGDVIDSVIIENSEDDTVPVTLSSFTANYINPASILSWTTQSESSNFGWNIYRADSEDYTVCSLLNTELIEGAGTSSTPTNYTFTDPYPVIEEEDYWFWIESISLSGESEVFGPISLTIPNSDPGQDTPDIPETYGLYQNYPNPFNPATVISFNLENAQETSLEIYNYKGQKIKTLLSNRLEAGSYDFRWNGTDAQGKEVSSGIYLYKLETSSYIKVNKMILLK